MFERVFDLRQAEYRRKHLAGEWVELNWEARPRNPHPGPAIEYVTDFSSGRTVKLTREVNAFPEPPPGTPIDAPVAPQKRREARSGYCRWFGCLSPLEKGQRRYCSGECRERDKSFHRKELAQWRRTVANMSEGDEDYVTRVVDEASYLKIVRHLQTESSFFVTKGAFGTWQSLEIEGPKIIVDILKQEQVRGLHGARKRRPILPGELTRDDEVVDPEEDLVSLTIRQDNAVCVKEYEREKTAV